MIGRVLRHDGELLNVIIEEIINVKIDRRRPGTSYIENMKSEVGPTKQTTRNWSAWLAMRINGGTMGNNSETDIKVDHIKEKHTILWICTYVLAIESLNFPCGWNNSRIVGARDDGCTAARTADSFGASDAAIAACARATFVGCWTCHCGSDQNAKTQKSLHSCKTVNQKSLVFSNIFIVCRQLSLAGGLILFFTRYYTYKLEKV